MILQFTVKNYRSIKEKQEFSMMAEKKVKEFPGNLIDSAKLKILSSAVIYGRNASGKSNLIKAIEVLQAMVIDHSIPNLKQSYRLYDPCRVDSNSSNLPVEFKIEFIASDKIKYDYEVIFNEQKIIKETLWFYPKNQIALLFDRREDSEIIYGEYLAGRKKDIESSLYANQLFLSKVRGDKIEKLIAPFSFFTKGLFIWNGSHVKNEDLMVSVYSNRIARIRNKEFNHNMNLLMKNSDTGTEGFLVKEIDTRDLKLPEDMEQRTKDKILNDYKFQIRTIHKLYKKGKAIGEIEFKLEDESTGTIKLLLVGGLILEALADGQVIIIDELDKSLHPTLCKELIKLFQNKKTNPKGAQLIFATHDVSLLNMDLFRRDQIWLVENEAGKGSSYYSLSDVQGVRNNIPLEKWYMSGRFGATPVINDMEMNFKF